MSSIYAFDKPTHWRMTHAGADRAGVPKDKRRDLGDGYIEVSGKDWQPRAEQPGLFVDSVTLTDDPDNKR